MHLNSARQKNTKSVKAKFRQKPFKDSFNLRGSSVALPMFKVLTYFCSYSGVHDHYVNPLEFKQICASVQQIMLIFGRVSCCISRKVGDIEGPASLLL